MGTRIRSNQILRLTWSIPCTAILSIPFSAVHYSAGSANKDPTRSKLGSNLQSNLDPTRSHKDPQKIKRQTCYRYALVIFSSEFQTGEKKFGKEVANLSSGSLLETIENWKLNFSGNLLSAFSLKVLEVFEVQKLERFECFELWFSSKFIISTTNIRLRIGPKESLEKTTRGKRLAKERELPVGEWRTTEAANLAAPLEIHFYNSFIAAKSKQIRWAEKAKHVSIAGFNWKI